MNINFHFKTKKFFSLPLRVLTLVTLVVNAVAIPIVTVQAQSGEEVGLISYWDFNEGSGLTANDTSPAGHGNTGTLMNNPQWVSSQFGSALEFNAAADQYVSTLNNDDSLSIPSGGLTITAWINAYDVSGVRNILAKDKEAVTARGNYSLAVVDGKLRFGFSQASDYGDNWIDTQISISPNRWYFVAVTHTYGNSGETAIYINGVSQPLSAWNCDWGCDPDSMPATFANDPLYIGKSICNGEQFDGLIDEVRVYNVALSPEEIPYIPVLDNDLDGIEDAIDNCPFVSNPDQSDNDGNGVGDACEPTYEPIYEDLLISDTFGKLWDLDLQTLDLNEFQQFDTGGNFDIIHAGSNEIFIAGFGSQRIERFNLETRELTVVAEGEPLVSPIGLALSHDGGMLYIADHSGKILSFDLQTNQFNLLADRGPNDEQFNAPDGIVVDEDGNVIFGDHGGSIYRIDPQDKSISLIVNNGAELNGMQFLNAEELLVASQDSPPALFRVNVNTGAVETLYSGTPFRNPEDVAIDAQANIVYVLDSDFKRDYPDFLPGIYRYNLQAGTLEPFYVGEPLGDIVDLLMGSLETSPYYPSFSVRLTENQVHGYGWLLGSEVILSIDGNEIDTQIVVKADWDSNQTFVWFDLGESLNFQAGQFIEMTDGTITKSHIITGLVVTGADPDTDTVFGTADPDAQVDIGHIDCDENGCYGFRREIADSNGDWLANFSVPGEDDDEQDIIDITPGMGSEARQCDEDGDCTMAEWNIPYPPRFGIQVGNSLPSIHSSGFLPNALLTATVDNLGTPESPDYTTTATTDPDGWAIFNLYYDAQPDDIVTLTDGVNTESLVVRYLIITSVNAETDTISGTTDPFQKIRVWSPNDINFPYITATADENGNWNANYSGIYDLTPGLDGFVETGVEDHGNTMTSWRVPNPRMTVFPEWEAVEVWDWPEEAMVTASVEGKSACTVQGLSEYPEWDPWTTNVWMNFPENCDVTAGDTVTVTDGSTQRSHVVLDLTLTDVNPSTDTITGMAEPGSTVVVWPHEYDQDATLEVEAGLDDGVWVADYTGLFDLGIGTGGRSQIFDEMGNATAVDWNVLSYTLHSVPAHPEVHGHDWALGSDVTLIIDNDTDPNNGTLYEETKNADDDPWCGYPCFDLNGVFDLQVGQYTTMTDGDVSKTVQVSVLTVTEVDYENDILRGSADEGSTVQVNIWSQDGISRTVQADDQNSWMVNFSVPGNGYNEMVADIGPGDNGRAIQLNPDGTDDGTLEYWNVPNPFIQVRANFDHIEGYEWPVGATIIIEIDDPGTPAVSPDYSDTVTVGTAPWDPNQTYFELPLWDVIDIQPGFVVTATDGVTTRQHTVVNLEFTNIDIDSDIVTGTAAHDSQIDIWACEFNNCFNVDGVPVDELGVWSADFQGIHDIQPGTWIDSIQYDEFGNGTMFGQNVEGAEIAGTIYALENEPVIEAGGVMVEACKTDQSVCRNALTDESGNYTIAYLPKGEFNLKAYPAGDELPGYSDEPINITDYITYYAEDIVLPGPPTPPPSGAIEPSHEGGGTISVYIGDPLTLTAIGCPDGTASFELTVLDDGYTRTGVMNETSLGSGTYKITTPPLAPHHGVAEIVYTIICPDGSTEETPFFIYIDPSGVVVTTSGIPIAGATVTLLRSDSPDGPFEVVPDGSVLMSPSNRTNPDTTDEYGMYGWDVMAGFYIVRAEFPGCFSPDDPSQPFVESDVLTIPPPVTDLALVLECPNLPPRDVKITAPIDPIPVTEFVTVQVDFNDPDENDGHTVVIDWGDETTTTTSISGLTAIAVHQYQSAGVYTIVATVTDSFGETATATYQYVVIYDPEGGFVTGGGWINSPEGAYTPDPSLTGKATFGFVSKYQKGATVPTGNTEFQFKVADLNFKSTSYDWLVIAGTKAMYKGTGTINGTGEYKFMLSAIDGSPDKFRIKIWDAETGAVIYDNMLDADDMADPATEIQGGSIVVHKVK